ncbi:MAG TPA: RDD family protein [Burkholderiales bacterium]
MKSTPSSAPANLKPAATRPSIARRLAAMVYEALLVVAIVMVAAFVFYGAATTKLEGAARLGFQSYLVVVLGLYFVWCWRRGQTLAMKAWKLRLVRVDGTQLSIAHALLRFVLATMTIGAGVLGAVMLWQHPHAIRGWFALAAGIATIGWAWIDREGQFLHDHLARTRLVLIKGGR